MELAQQSVNERQLLCNSYELICYSNWRFSFCFCWSNERNLPHIKVREYKPHRILFPAWSLEKNYGKIFLMGYLHSETKWNIVSNQWFHETDLCHWNKSVPKNPWHTDSKQPIGVRRKAGNFWDVFLSGDEQLIDIKDVVTTNKTDIKWSGKSIRNPHNCGFLIQS